MPIVYKRGLTASDIAQVELELGKSLPVEYRIFLQEMNGFFIAAPDYVKIPLSSVEEGLISFDRLFGWLPEEECNDMVAFNQEFIEELAFLNNAIAIGEDGGGNPYVIVSEPKRTGIYYWDRTHSHEDNSIRDTDIPERNDSGSLYFISPSLGEFYKLISNQTGGNPVAIEDA
jgi:hypothetical protein